MSELAAASAGGVTVEHHLLAEVVTRQLEAMLSVGNYDAVKLLLEPPTPATNPSWRPSSSSGSNLSCTSWRSASSHNTGSAPPPSTSERQRR